MRGFAVTMRGAPHQVAGCLRSHARMAAILAITAASLALDLGRNVPPRAVSVALCFDRSSAMLAVGSRVRAVDTDGAVLHASVVEEREETIRVRFDGWSARFDEWYPVDSELITPLAQQGVEKAALRVATGCLRAHDRHARETSGQDGDRGAASVVGEGLSALREAVRVVARSSDYVMLGFMGDDPTETVAALRMWQQALGLVQPPLCVIDDESGEGACSAPGLPDTVALGELPATSLEAPAYLKFNSMSGFNMLKPHDGPHRGAL